MNPSPEQKEKNVSKPAPVGDFDFLKGVLVDFNYRRSNTRIREANMKANRKPVPQN